MYTDPRNAELEQRIHDDPYCDESYLALAEWLKGQGDPRGEFALRQHARDVPGATRLLKEHEDYLLGPLALPLERAYHFDLRWHAGFIHTAELRKVTQPSPKLARVLEMLLRHPSARFLAELELRGDLPMMDEMLFHLAREERPCLRRLDVTGLWSGTRLGDMTALWAALPRLTHLTFSVSCELGQIVLPSLRHAWVRTSSSADKQSLATAHWPLLESLRYFP